MTRLKTCLFFVIPAFVVVVFSGCGKTSELPTDMDSVAQMAQTATSDVDESFTQGGGITARIDRRSPSQKAYDFFVPSAYAASCSTAAFTCTSGTATRTFSSCTLGLGGFTRSGSVILTMTDGSSAATCSRANAVTTIRKPSFTISGRRSGADLTVSSTGVTAFDTSVTFGEGQKLTKNSAESFTFETLGINRKLVTSTGTEIFNISSKTSTALSVTGSTRATRKITAGVLDVYHNVAKYKVSWSFANVQYASTCSEPVSGVLTGTVTGSRTGTVTLTFNGCGSAEISYTDGDKGAVVETSQSDNSSDA